MSFENGYDIMEYIGETVAKYDEDNTIFDKSLRLLNIYMARQDWPYCYEEYSKVTSKILGHDGDWISKYYGQFSSEANQGHQRLNEWDKNLTKAFKNDWMIFSNVIRPIIEQYYDYINNPLGVKKLVRVSGYGSKSVIRIERNDGQILDLFLHDHDIKTLSSGLLKMIAQG